MRAVPLPPGISAAYLHPASRASRIRPLWLPAHSPHNLSKAYLTRKLSVSHSSQEPLGLCIGVYTVSISRATSPGSMPGCMCTSVYFISSARPPPFGHSFVGVLIALSPWLRTWLVSEGITMLLPIHHIPWSTTAELHSPAEEPRDVEASGT